MTKIKTLLLGAFLVPIMVTFDPATSVENPIASIDDAISTASANIVSNIRTGRHLGFDTYVYPGDDAMLAWRDDDVPYEWVGYYLPAPCHKSDSWSGKRATLTNMGWGLAVIYVGQQVWSGVPGKPVVGAAKSPAWLQLRDAAGEWIARNDRRGGRNQPGSE